MRTRSVVLLGEFSRVVSSCHYRDELEEVQQGLPQRSTPRGARKTKLQEKGHTFPSRANGNVDTP